MSLENGGRLSAALPSAATESATDGSLLEVRDLTKHFPIHEGAIIRRRSGAVQAVDGVSFSIGAGETLGLVGESGCGKTTTGYTIMQLEQATSGQVIFEGQDLTILPAGERRRARRRMQMIFQDPFGSLNPRMTVGKIIEDPLIVHNLGDSKAERRDRVHELLQLVGLTPGHAVRYPHEFSGGQRQRIATARSLAVRPSFIVCDEPVSALDVSIQAQIINLLRELQQAFGVAYLFIAHDLNVVRHISDRVAVMYVGRIAETASSDDLYVRPLHPYTRALLSAIPYPDPEVEAERKRIFLPGDVPSPASPPSG
ncbi:MAG: ATP-binding cassette domain-containing protein, partial [Chromatiales bacterium]|nr:ATP-binding cassette domain-containing protein [Chromatiales bacterium]